MLKPKQKEPDPRSDDVYKWASNTVNLSTG